MSVSLPLLDQLGLPLACGGDEKPLAGIARLAAEGESIREGHNVEYFTLASRSLLNRSTGRRMHFTWTINPYRGCEFACKYCYARYTHEFMEIHDNIEFERKIYVKQHVAWLLKNDLRRVKPGEEIAIGTATDPYQPAEKRYEVTREILEELANHAGLSIGIVTKSNLVVRDIDVLRLIADRNELEVNITVTTTNIDLARILEPRAVRPDLRLEAVHELNAAGVAAGVICAPVIPGITDRPQQLEALVRATAEAGGRHIFSQPLFLKPCSASVFLPFLAKEFPELVENYRERYGSRSFVSTEYRKRIGQLMARLRRKYGFVSRTRSKKASEDPRESSGGCGGGKVRRKPVPDSDEPLFEPQLGLF